MVRIPEQVPHPLILDLLSGILHANPFRGFRDDPHVMRDQDQGHSRFLL